MAHLSSVDICVAVTRKIEVSIYFDTFKMCMKTIMEKGTFRKEAQRTNLQILARISPLPVAKSCPVGLGATEITANPNVS